MLDACEQANDGAPITFEITTAAAFLAFARHPADAVLLETGLGGRLDATNVIERPRLTALSPISVDHQAFLGERLEQIAFEKAGILKPGVPCIVGLQHPAALAVIEERARALGAPPPCARPGMARAARAIGCWWPSAMPSGICRCRPSRAVTRSTTRAWRSPARSALEDLAPETQALAQGLRAAKWPGRLQRLMRGPLVALLPATCELWLDGGHNPAAAKRWRRAWTAPTPGRSTWSWAC